jgi:cytochrome subunit of sulfide dehydrogenase
LNGVLGYNKSTMKYLVLVGSLSAILMVASLAHAAEVVSSTETHSNTPHIRTLAASCAACHGNNGNALHGNAVLAGMDGSQFTSSMLAFKDGSRPATVMHRHAKGLNVDEINLLADYFSRQKRVPSQPPLAQTLGAGHE